MPGVVLGRQFILQHSVDDGVTWLIVGAVNSSEPSNANPTTDVTTQSNEENNSEMTHSGYSQFQVSVSGIVKEETIVGFLSYKDLSAIAFATPVTARKGLFQLIDANESFTGTMLISEFSRSGGRSDVNEFSMTLQAEGPDFVYAAI